MKTAVSAQLRLWGRHVAKRAKYGANIKLWLLAGITGFIVAYGTLGFLVSIEYLTKFFYGASPEKLASGIRGLDKARVWIVPVIGGFIVGLLLYIAKRLKWLEATSCEGVAKVIESRAEFDKHISLRGGIVNTAVAAIALGSGASAGREGPAVLMSGSIATFLSERLNLSAKDARTMLGCAAAAAVSASFNTPIAGVLFALEVILGNYALSIFGPIALSSTVAAIVARQHFGNVLEFSIPDYGIPTHLDVPLAAGLGLICGLVAFAFMQSCANCTKWTRIQLRRHKIDPAFLPPVAGIMMGSVAIFFPEILGVGYEATIEAIKGNYGLKLLTILLVLKVIATVVCLVCRFGTGVFSGGIFFGAVSGAAFGLTLNYVMPDLVAGPAFYAMIGMGAVSGAIIGAPISTTLIVFELTGDYQMTIALMVAVGVANLVAQLTFGKSWFHWQLAQRGYDLSDGPQGVILQTIRVRDVMRITTDQDTKLSEDAPRLRSGESLGEALAKMVDLEVDGLPVCAYDNRAKIIGYLTHIKALREYNKALIEDNIEHNR